MDVNTLPPGTHIIENTRGTKVLLAPQPNSDPNQPLNWSPLRKWVHMTILSLYALMVFACLCISVPIWGPWNTELGISYDQLNNGYATNMAALAVGCIVFVPLGLRYGRRPVYLVTSLILTAMCIWQAKLETLGDYIATQAILGIAGCVNEALFQVTVSDLFFVHQRATMNGVYLIMVMIGNYLGPVASGYVAVNISWRWAFWICGILQGVVTLLIFFFLEESKYTEPYLVGLELTRGGGEEQVTKANSIAKDSPNQSSNSAEEAASNQLRRLVSIDTSIPMKSYRERFALWQSETKDTSENRSIWQHMYQPFLILGTFPAVMFAALQYGFAIAMLAILAISQATLYAAPPYNFSPIGVGNMNIPPAIGAILGSLFGGPLVDYLILQVAKRRGGIHEPETRLWLFLVPGLSMVIGTLMFGLTIAKGMPWIINAVGAGFIGFAIGGTGDMALTYVQDSYQQILGNALTAVVFVRNIIATALVFAITPWMTNLGVYNMHVMLGCISAAIALTCVPMIIWGRSFRVRLADKYRHYTALQY